MPVVLPQLPRGAVATPRLISFGGDLTPTLGGPVQRIVRVGSRYAIDVEMPTLDGQCARDWISALIDCEREIAVLRFPQPGLEIGNPGAPVVNGGGQAGSRLSVRGFSANYPVRNAQFFTMDHQGRRYLHKARAANASGTGVALLDIAPMLRVIPFDSVALNFAAPTIEGWVKGPETAWSVGRRFTKGLSFTITEAE